MSQVLVYGGRGALGASIVSHFKARGFNVTSVDLAANDEANSNILIAASDSWEEQSAKIVNQLSSQLEGKKLEAVLCVAGGWAGGNAASDDLIKNTDLMIKQSVWSSVIASQIAAKFLSENGMIALTGARAALQGTSGMIGYGLAKAAVHQLTRSLAAPNSGLPSGSTSVALLPVTLDTPMNRKFMSNADFSSWTPTETIAAKLHSWLSGVDRPASGSLIEVVTTNGDTSFTKVEI